MVGRRPRGEFPRPALDRRWDALLRAAHDRGRLIVMLRATPLTMRWLPRALEAKRLGAVAVVPLTSLLEKPGPP